MTYLWLTSVNRTEDLDLTELAKRSEIREGDLLVYKRKFPNLQLTVEKDILVSLSWVIE